MLEKILIITFIVWAVHVVLWNNMIFGFISRWFATWMPEWLQKPVYDCVVCQSPYYGSIAYWLIWGNGWQEWIVVIICTIGLNGIIVSFLPKEDIS